MKQIRTSVFETNSSSTHSIAISKKPVTIGKYIYFGIGEFGWENDCVNTADYLYTANRLNPITENTISNARLVEDDEELMHIIRIMDGVHPDFLQVLYNKAKEQCGDMENLLREKLGMTHEKIAKLRELYLE